MTDQLTTDLIRVGRERARLEAELAKICREQRRLQVEMNGQLSKLAKRTALVCDEFENDEWPLILVPSVEPTRPITNLADWFCYNYLSRRKEFIAKYISQTQRRKARAKAFGQWSVGQTGESYLMLKAKYLWDICLADEGIMAPLRVDHVAAAK